MVKTFLVNKMFHMQQSVKKVSFVEHKMISQPISLNKRQLQTVIPTSNSRSKSLAQSAGSLPKGKTPP